jgi:uncharacterized protein (DUF58 family)
MAKNKKKTKSAAQSAVGLATSWMPQPLADFFGTPFGTTLLVLGAPFLLATGVITINWSNGAPAVTFDKERAVAVGREVEQTVEAQVETEAKLVVERIRAEESQRGQPQPPALQQMAQPMMRPVMQPPLLQGAAQPAPPAWR